MNALEEIIDVARSRMMAATTLDEISGIPKQFETDCGLPASQTKRLEAWVSFRVGDVSKAIDLISAGFNEDRYFGSLIDLGYFFTEIEFPNSSKRDEIIGALAAVSNQLRQNGMSVYALRADFVVSYLLYRMQADFPALRPVAKIWREQAGVLKYAPDDLDTFLDGS